METSNGLIRTDLTSNVTRIEALEDTVIISNSSGITTGFTKGDIIYASSDNTLSKLGVGIQGDILTVGASAAVNWVTPASQPTTLDEIANTGNNTSNTLLFQNPTTAFVATGNIEALGSVTIAGNLTISGTTTTVDTENLLVKDPIIALSDVGGAVDAGVLINRPAPGNNVFSGFDHTQNEYVIGYTDNSAIDSVIVMKEAENFVANVYGNVKANYFVGDGSLLTGISGGGGTVTLQSVTDTGNTTSNTVQFTNTGTSLLASGDIISKNIQLTNPGITVSFAGGTLTLDAANKTYGTGSLLTLSQNMTTLSYTNLINGAQVIIPVVASGGNYTISNVMTNVDYFSGSEIVTVNSGGHGLITLSNLHGNIYMNALAFQSV